MKDERSDRPEYVFRARLRGHAVPPDTRYSFLVTHYSLLATRQSPVHDKAPAATEPVAGAWELLVVDLAEEVLQPGGYLLKQSVSTLAGRALRTAKADLDVEELA